MNNNQELTLHTLPKIKNISIKSIGAFIGHWQRLFGECHLPKRSAKNTNIDLKQNSAFWRAIVTEILATDEFSLLALQQMTDHDSQFWQKLLSFDNTITMPASLGVKLLNLHMMLRPDLQAL